MTVSVILFSHFTRQYLLCDLPRTVRRVKKRANTVSLWDISRTNVCVICLLNSQMSNLMNQARLKVLKARDDMISVSLCHHFIYVRKMGWLNITAESANRRDQVCFCTLRKC